MQPGQGTMILEVFPTLTILGACDFEVVQTHSGCSVLGLAWFTPGCCWLGLCSWAPLSFTAKPNPAAAMPPPPTAAPSTSGWVDQHLGLCSRKEIFLPGPLQSCFSSFAGFLHTTLPLSPGSWLPWLGEEQPGPAHPLWGWERTRTEIWISPKSGVNQTC